MNKAITIHTDDNVAVALMDLKLAERVEINGSTVELKQNIAAKHKFALADFSKNEEIFMYGVKVGITNRAISKGEAITTENTKHLSAEYNFENVGKFSWTAPDSQKFRDTTFMGYHRNDGQVGTRNYWLVFPLVFCENRNIEIIKKAFVKGLNLERKDHYASLVKSLASQYKSGNPVEASFSETTELIAEEQPVFKNLDGIRFLTHQSGCGGTRQDAETLCRLLAGYVNNPNVAGATILSLGCQNAEIELFKKSLDSINSNFNKPLLYFDQQESGTEKSLVENAIRKTFIQLIEIDKIERKPASIDKLVVGLECGGSDGFSGISANPTMGYAADLLASLNGKAILSEFPELCGVEQELINRSVDMDTAQKFSRLMRHYEKSAEAAGSGFDMNPSPGNIKDGLITDAMKSAGAAKKGGTSPVTDVLDYTEYVKKNGLSLLCTPGNDVESTTGLAGSGANIIVFSTGLGTPTGNPVTPVIKISSNSSLAKRMPDIIDLDTGAIITGEKTIRQMGEELLEFIVDVASGQCQTKADMLGQFDFIPWKRGVSL